INLFINAYKKSIVGSDTSLPVTHYCYLSGYQSEGLIMPNLSSNIFRICSEVRACKCIPIEATTIVVATVVIFILYLTIIFLFYLFVSIVTAVVTIVFTLVFVSGKCWFYL